MKKKHLILRYISAILALSIFLLCSVSAADDTPVSENKVSTSQDEAHASYEKLAKFLGFYEAPEGYTYPDEYAGCYINDANKLVICLTENTLEVQKKYVSACGENVLFQSAEYSLAELLKTGTALTAFNGGEANVVVRYNAEKNKIRIFLDEDYSAVRNNIESYIAKGNTADVIAERGSRDAVITRQLGMVEYVYTNRGKSITERDDISNAVNSLQRTTAVLPGGRINNDGGTFTAGVWVNRTVNGVPMVGLVTCGHAFINRNTGYDPDKAIVRYGNTDAEIGIVHQADVFSHEEAPHNLDTAFVTRTNFTYSPTTVLYVQIGTGTLNRLYANGNINLSALQGSDVTIIGQRTGGIAGRISDQDIMSETITQGFAVEFTSTTHAKDGDSGGPVIYTDGNGVNSLVGFQSEIFSIGDISYSAVVNASVALNALGATIYTGN